MSQGVKLDSGEMKEFLNHIISNNRFIQAKGIKPVATEVIGEAGLGKTTVVEQVAKANNLSLVKINLAQIEELGDLVGYPIKQYELCKKSTVSVPVEKEPEYEMVKKKLPNGKIVMKKVIKNPGETVKANSQECLWIDDAAIEQYTKQGYEFTGNKRMSYAPPEWIADKEGGGILLVDDWSRADQRFIQAMMEVCDRQTYISWKLPKDWHIILTANPDNGEYQVTSMDVAQKTRFASIEMKFSEERWAEWAEQAKIDGRCINFILMNPEVVQGACNPRALTTFFNTISSFKSFEGNLAMVQMLGEGTIGSTAATLFTQFIHNKLDQIISPKEVFTKTDADVKKALRDAMYENGDLRADLASVIHTRIINYIVNYSLENKIEEKHLNRLKLLLNEKDLFTDDYKFNIAKKVVAGNKVKFAKLIMDRSIQEMVVK